MADIENNYVNEGSWKSLLGQVDRLPHALLVHGPRGVGKLALAERFAQYLLCEGRKAGAGLPCGACPACRWFALGNHPDLRLIEPEAIARSPQTSDEDAAQDDEEGAEESVAEAGGGRRRRQPSTQIRVEQARSLGDFLALASHRGGRRIALLHPAEEMTVAAANALLKSLEEPPAGAVFILVSHRPERLLATVRSRCVPVPVPVPDADEAAQWLAERGLKAPERWLAFAGGAPRRALEYATGEPGEAIEQVLRVLASGDRMSLASVRERADLEPLIEVLQKLALDRAFSALTGKGKYALSASAGKPGRGEARAWLDYARWLGKNRALAAHPLNPRLLASELVVGMPET